MFIHRYRLRICNIYQHYVLYIYIYICTLYAHTIYTILYLHRQVLYTCYLVQAIHAISTRSDHGAGCRLLESPTHQEILQLTRMKMRSQRWNMLFCSVFGFVVEAHFATKRPWNMSNKRVFLLDIQSLLALNWHFDTLL